MADTRADNERLSPFVRSVWPLRCQPEELPKTNLPGRRLEPRMEPAAQGESQLTLTHWLIIIIASIGFAFDTYELLMTPLAAPPAIAEILQVPLNHSSVTDWTGRLLWITAICGGVFGLLGGWLTDRFGRKSVMAAAIFVYSFSPMLAAYSTSLGLFIFFRCTTFIGVCVEFVAAITWIAEVFENPAQKVKWLGITQAFASVGGLMVTSVNVWIVAHAASLPAMELPLALGATAPATWRYLLMTGLIPALPIALMLPFVPESKVWRERKTLGTLKRPSFAALFSPELRRVTLVTAGLSACAYGVAFGALQLTPLRIAPGLPELAEQFKELAPLRREAAAINKQFDQTQPGSTERKELIAKLKENRAKQEPYDKIVKRAGNHVQFYQELGGLAGRIALALLVIAAVPRRLLLRLFQVPGLLVVPLAYFLLFKQNGTVFAWGIALVGFVTVAQFSYFGEYLPKVFPLHLRATGGSFATNVGGRMIGTSAAFVTTNFVAPLIAGDPQKVLPAHVAQAAGCVALGIVVIGLVLGSFLPEPKEQAPE
jgi:MFS family permease